MSRRFRAGIVLALAAVAVPVSPAAAAKPSVADRVLADAAAHGIDARPLLARTVMVAGRRMAVAQAVEVLGGARTASGPAGTPEVQINRIAHGAVTYGPGAQPPYHTVLASPTPALPGVSQWAPATPVTHPVDVAVYGGRPMIVRGSGFIGGHTVGGPAISLSTDTSGPNGFWLSGLHEEGSIADTAIDYAGHTTGFGNLVECYGSFCVGMGWIFGNGTAVYG